MSKRKSLYNKIQYCCKFGTIRTYSLNEAIQHHKELYFTDQEIKDIHTKYESGKILCAFIVFPEFDGKFDTVMQFNTLGNFIRDVVYFMLID